VEGETAERAQDSCLTVSDQLHQSDQARNRTNHSLLVGYHTSRGQITFLCGHLMITSGISMVFPDNTPTRHMPYRKTALPSNLLSAFTPTFNLNLGRSSVIGLPTFVVAVSTNAILSSKGQSTYPDRSFSTHGTCFQRC
jgi:hypothetical protein